MTHKFQEISQDIRTQANRLRTDGWDKLRAVRLAHAAGTVREELVQAGWLEATGRAEDLALQVSNFIGKTPSEFEIGGLARLAEGLADCLEHFLLAGLDESFLPADTGDWAFLLVGEGLSAASPLFARLDQAGFKVETVASSEALSERVDVQQRRAIIVADADWLSVNPVSLTRNRIGEEGVIVIALADESSFMKRLAAQRAGANMLLDKSVSAKTLVATLSGQAWQPRKPYRVMIVDDDAMALEFHTLLLRNQGMEVVAMQDPVAVLELLEEFEPEALIVDIEMPACRGTELVAMLRQRESRALLPVIYLSAHGDAEHLLEARRAGGEDYLVKPVSHELFHAAVSTRARKYRMARQIDREREQERLKHQRLQETLDAHAIVSIVAKDGAVVDGNEKLCMISGRSREEIIGRNPRIDNSGYHSPEFFRELWETITSGQTWRGEVKNRRKDGRFYWIKETIVPFPDSDVLPGQYIAVRTDITEQKFHQELHEARGRLLSQGHVELKALLEQVIVEMKSLWLTNEVIPAIFLLNNQATLRVGAAPDLPGDYKAAINEAGLGLGADICNLIPAANEENEPNPDWAVCRTLADKADLRACWALPIRIPSGETVGSFAIYHRTPHLSGRLEQVMLAEFAEIVGILVDRNQMIQGRAKSEYLLTSLLQAAKEGYWRVDAKGVTLEVNQTFCEIVGRSKPDLIGKPYTEIMDAASVDAAIAQFTSVSEGKPITGELRVRRPDGDMVTIMMRGGLVPSADGASMDQFALVTDITEQKQLEASLHAAKESAEAASRAKSEFLASMSHELRTPLNAILGFSQLFGMDPDLPEDTKEQAREIERAGQHLLSLVSDLIDLARIEAGKLELSMEPVPLKSVVEESLAMVAPIARKHGIELIDMNCAKDGRLVRADYVRLRQVVINFLSNAIKYNRPQGSVRLSCQETEGKVRISISDTGLGIPADKQARIFSAFDRLGAERGGVEGTGIGLVITQRIVEAMGGTIGFESVEGQGSTFWVEFQTDVMNEFPLLKADAFSQAAESSSRKTGIPVILYVEDNPMNLRLMQQIFAVRKDLELRDANTAELGIELARAEPPALILMDINLPGMDGYEALAQLKADPRTAHIPVIAVTANAMKGDEARGLEAGFDAYLTKPIDIPALFAALNKLFG